MNNSLRNIVILFGLIFIGYSTGNSQLIPGKLSSAEARQHIQALEKGALIVPLFKQENRQAKIREMAFSDQTDPKTRERLRDRLKKDSLAFHSFNALIVTYFTDFYQFSKVYFIYDHQLKQFDPQETVFLGPEDLQPDPAIRYDGGSYYFLQYHNFSSVATAPEDVRFFYIADKQNNRLDSPFPFSPGRKNSLIRRFRQLIGMEPSNDEQIKNLTIKLNELLYRYSKS